MKMKKFRNRCKSDLNDYHVRYLCFGKWKRTLHCEIVVDKFQSWCNPCNLKIFTLISNVKQHFQKFSRVQNCRMIKN